MHKSFVKLKDLIMSQTNPFKAVVHTETWLSDEKAHNYCLFLILNCSSINQIRKCSRESGGVVVFIHKSLNYKVTHD